MKLVKRISVLAFFIIVIFLFSGCEIETTDFSLMCDDDDNDCTMYGIDTTESAGNDIVPTEELITACAWILNQEDVNIRLHTCTKEEYRYPNPDAELPGGAIQLAAGNAKAKKTIPLSEYQMGVFFGEENIESAPEARKAFMIIYRTVFVHNTVHYAINFGRDPLKGDEISYAAGSCSQNYRNTQRVSKYDSGKYKQEIDDTLNLKYRGLV